MFPYLDEELVTRIVNGAFAGAGVGIAVNLVNLVTYILTAMALYTIAQRRELKKAWLAWIPVANSWIIGSISDQYHYVTHRENRSKRKVLLVLSILLTVLVLAALALAGQLLIRLAVAMMNGYGDARVLEALMDSAVGFAGIFLPLAGVGIAYTVVYYMALYDIYRSLDPSSSVVYLVLSILFSVTTGFFLFLSRNKEQGMPPRRCTGPADGSTDSTQEQPWRPVGDRKDPWEQG